MAADPQEWIRKLPSRELRFAAWVLLGLWIALAAFWALCQRHRWLRWAIYAQVALLAGWALAALVAGEIVRERQVALDLRGDELRALAAKLPPLAPAGLAPLETACEAALEPVGVAGLLSTVAPYAGAEEGWDPPLPVGHLLGSRGWGAWWEPGHAFRHDNAFEAWPKMFEEGPFLLPDAVRRSTWGRPDVLGARYLAVVHLQSAVPSAVPVAVTVLELAGAGRDDTPTARCTGQVTPASDYKGDVLSAPLQALCGTVSPALCEAMAKGGVQGL
jgi:hypothetical protein